MFNHALYNLFGLWCSCRCFALTTLNTGFDGEEWEIGSTPSPLLQCTADDPECWLLLRRRLLLHFDTLHLPRVPLGGHGKPPSRNLVRSFFSHVSMIHFKVQATKWVRSFQNHRRSLADRVWNYPATKYLKSAFAYRLNHSNPMGTSAADGTPLIPFRPPCLLVVATCNLLISLPPYCSQFLHVHCLLKLSKYNNIQPSDQVGWGREHVMWDARTIPYGCLSKQVQPGKVEWSIVAYWNETIGTNMSCEMLEPYLMDACLSKFNLVKLNEAFSLIEMKRLVRTY